MVKILLQRLLYSLLQLLKCSYRIHYIGKEHLDEARLKHPQGSVVFACWHEHLIGMMCAHRDLHTIVSRNYFGQIVGYVCRKFGYSIFFGSANRGQDKGGVQALLGLSRSLKSGATAVVTVDGSVGPRRIAKKGVLEIAYQSHAHIVPLAVASSHYWEFATWDRLKLPKPFSQVVITYGPALVVASRSDDGYTTMVSSLGAAIDHQEARGLQVLRKKMR